MTSLRIILTTPTGTATELATEKRQSLVERSISKIIAHSRSLKNYSYSTSTDQVQFNKIIISTELYQIVNQATDSLQVLVDKVAEDINPNALILQEALSTILLEIRVQVAVSTSATIHDDPAVPVNFEQNIGYLHYALSKLSASARWVIIIKLCLSLMEAL